MVNKNEGVYQITLLNDVPSWIYDKRIILDKDDNGWADVLYANENKIQVSEKHGFIAEWDIIMTSINYQGELAFSDGVFLIRTDDTIHISCPMMTLITISTNYETFYDRYDPIPALKFQANWWKEIIQGSWKTRYYIELTSKPTPVLVKKLWISIGVKST